MHVIADLPQYHAYLTPQASSLALVRGAATGQATSL